MKKQILAGVLSATMVVGMGGVSVFAADNADDKTYNIGICQLVQHEALDAATQGFKDAITEELGDKVTFDEQNAQGDSNTCSTIITDFVSDGVDLILANATPALQAASAGTADIPILVLQLPNMVLHLTLTISTELLEPTFPVHLTLLHWISRQQCSTNCSRMQKCWSYLLFSRSQFPVSG